MWVSSLSPFLSCFYISRVYVLLYLKSHQKWKVCELLILCWSLLLSARLIYIYIYMFWFNFLSFFFCMNSLLSLCICLVIHKYLCSSLQLFKLVRENMCYIFQFSVRSMSWIWLQFNIWDYLSGKSDGCEEQYWISDIDTRSWSSTKVSNPFFS